MKIRAFHRCVQCGGADAVEAGGVWSGAGAVLWMILWYNRIVENANDKTLLFTVHLEALQTLRCIMSNLEYRFYKAYGMEIEDKRRIMDNTCDICFCLFL